MINSVINGKEDCVDIQVYDIEKAFDSLWLDECFNDLFDVIPIQKRNDQISLLYSSNLNNMVAVNTPAGLTERVNMPSIIQQGGVWGSILCSNTIDTIGKKCDSEGKHLYTYKKPRENFTFGICRRFDWSFKMWRKLTEIKYLPQLSNRAQEVNIPYWQQCF